MGHTPLELVELLPPPDCAGDQPGGAIRLQKRLALLDANKSEERVPVDDVSDIFAHAGRIREMAQRHLEKAVRPPA